MADSDASAGPCRLRDLIQSGQATFNYHDYREWAVWFDSSAAVLQLNESDCIRQARAGQPGNLAFGVTPALLSRTIALRVVHRLLLLYGAEFEVLLQTITTQSYQGATETDHSKRWWTEYALYGLEGCHSELFQKHHRLLEQGVYDEGNDTVFHASQLVDWDPAHVFRENTDSAPFIFFQSIISVKTGDLAFQMQPYLNS